MTHLLESTVETYFQKQIRLCGGVTFKFTSPSMRGVPDQIALFKGNTYFVELKAPGEDPRDSQIAVHELFDEHGVPVYTIDTIEMVDQFIKNILKTKVKPKKKQTFEIKDDVFL